MYTKAWTLAVVILLVPAVFGQADMPIQGTVVTQEGQPIEGVNVFGSQGKCCPVRREQTTTDKKGAFGLQHPGAVIHFVKESLQPRSIVVQPGRSALRITMSPVTNPIRIPGCGPLQQDQKRTGWGQYGPQFTVSERSFDIQGGKPDIDFVRYRIKQKQSQSFMELWFGPSAISVDPDDERFIDSIDFAQRFLLFRDRIAGLDSRGHLRGGGSWRHTALPGDGGAVYNKASADDAVAFDQVIDSMCYVPFPRK